MRQLVALLLPPGSDFVAQLRRAWDGGDAVLPLDARLPRPAVERLLAALQPSRLVEPGGEHLLAGGGRPVENGDALVVATSGTTGEPKGVVLTHGAVAASARATSARLGIDPSRHHWLCCLPVAHVGGLGVITRALWAGVALTVVERFTVEAVETALLPAGDVPAATHVSVVVTMLAQLSQRSPRSVEQFERIVLGGSAVPESLPDNVVPTYGLTETGSGCVYGHTPLEGVEVRIDDGGQILLRGPLLLRAYRTAAGELGPFLAGGWFPTGDLGRWDPTTSRLTVFGRAGDLIISGGQNVWPEPVERVLATVPGVAEVAVVGRPDERWGAAVTAVVVPADPAVPPTLAQLREAAKAELAPYCAPHRVELAEQLPRTALGKIRRNLL